MNFAGGSAAAFRHDEGKAPRGHVPEERQHFGAVELGRDARFALHPVCVAMGKDDHVARFERDAVLAGNPGESAALDNDMVRDQVARAAQQDRPVVVGVRHVHAARRRCVDGEEQCAGQLDGAQHVRKRVDRPVRNDWVVGETFVRGPNIRRPGRSVNIAGRAIMAVAHASILTS